MKIWQYIVSGISLLALGISIVSLIFSPTIGSENYIGIMTAFMDICATLMLGFQIFNAIDYRTRLNNIYEKVIIEKG